MEPPSQLEDRTSKLASEWSSHYGSQSQDHGHSLRIEIEVLVNLLNVRVSLNYYCTFISSKFLVIFIWW